MALSKILPASQDQYTGSRNLIINGAMQVWQRGTTIDTITSGDYFCDQWRIGHSGTDGNVDIDKSTDVPSGQGFAYSQKISMDASETSLAAADQVNIAQRFEGQNLQHLLKGTLFAKSITLSFWVKSSVAETYTVNLYDSNNSRQISATYVIDTANTWEKKTITFAGDTSGVLDNDNARSLDLIFWLDAGTSWTSGTFATSWESYTQSNRVYGTTGWLESVSPEFYITGIQFEVGEHATPFEHERYAETLRKCQRYYIRYPNIDDGSTTFYYVQGSIHNVGTIYYTLTLPVPMREQPDLIISNATHFQSIDSGTIRNLTNLTLLGDALIDNKVVTLQGSGVSLTPNRPSILRGDGTVGNYFALYAEL